MIVEVMPIPVLIRQEGIFPECLQQGHKVVSLRHPNLTDISTPQSEIKLDVI